MFGIKPTKIEKTRDLGIVCFNFLIPRQKLVYACAQKNSHSDARLLAEMQPIQ